MDFRTISKALAGAVFAGAAGVGTAVAIPADVVMPWYGYILVGVVNAAVGFLGVYYAPKNAA